MKNLQIHCIGPKSVAELTYHARIPALFLTYSPADGWMDGSPSTQIRLNIKKNKREGGGCSAHETTSDRQTDGDKKGEGDS